MNDLKNNNENIVQRFAKIQEARPQHSTMLALPRNNGYRFAVNDGGF